MKYNYLADFKEGIPYKKSLRQYTGSVTATILIQQLDFRFTKYPDGLYKFLSPVPEHPDYREGDSWTEELGFSEKEFRCAFGHIGVRHSSKTAYMQSTNPFIDESGEEKFYCSYHDKQKGLTWYFRNHEKVDALIEELIKLSPPRQGKRPSSLDSPVTAQKSVTVNDHRETCNLPKGSYVTDQRESTFIYKENTKNTNKEEYPLTPNGGNEPISELKISEGGEENAGTLALPPSKIEPIALTKIIVSVANVPPSAKKPKQDVEFFEPLRAIYNQVKPTTWAECKSLNDKRFRAFKRLYQELGDRTAQTMQEALCFVQHDRWWRETYSSRCIDGLLVSGRIQQLSDSYRAINPDANYNTNTGEIGVIDPDTGDRITDPNHIAILKGLGRI
jgi:hypothetical protein